MATVPLSGTNIRLLSGVPFSNDYKNTRWFDTQAEQEAYFLGKNVVHSIAQATFQRPTGKTFISVNKSIDDLWTTNYLMFKNPKNNQWWYAFVTHLEYVQTGTTYVHFQIDVFQSWKFYMNFKPSFVVREHCKLWNDDGSPVINTVDEGLNYGNEYETVKVDQYRPYGDIYFLVIVCKQTMHYAMNQDNEILPNMNGLPQPLCYYVHPFRMDGSTPGVAIGAEEGVGANSVLEVLKGIYTNKDAVNNVVSLYVTDHISGSITYDAGMDMVYFPDSEFMQALIHDGEVNFATVFAKNIYSYSEVSKTFTNKYSGYFNTIESKLWMYPYTVLIMDDLKGNRQVFKNEFIQGKDIKVTAKGSLGTSNKTAYVIEDYLVDGGLPWQGRDVSSLENGVISNNPNDIPIVTDMLSAYLQGNRNSLENQKNSIIFNGAINTVNSAIGGVASVANPNPAGIASGVVGGATGVVQGIGNTVLQIQGMNAKLADINNTPPSLVKMGGNTNFDYGNGFSGVYLIKKQIKPEYRKKIADFFNMFGYKVNEVKIPNFHTRKSWNYVQTTSCNITGNFNNEDLQELKNIFDSGITLWHTDDVGNYSLYNGVI